MLLTDFLKLPKGQARIFILTGGLIIFVIVMMAIFAPFIAPYNPTKGIGPVLQPPCLKYLMGTDNLGRDIFSRVVYGSRIVLVIVATAGFISMLIGVTLGLISGYLGGKFDRIFAMIMDSIYAFPSLILAIAISAILGPSIVNAIIAIAIVYIPTFYRMIRGQTLSLKTRLFVEAAKVIGASDFRILTKYILVNLIPTVAVIFSLCIADAIITAAGLSFLGFIVTAPTPDWGWDLSSGRDYLPAGFWWLITFPGLMIVLLAFGFALLGEGLNEIYSKEDK
ncbi:binding-protein-dependent transport systems inner membrane component [Thermodesulfatator indicus DSM 15286]|uniref:Binding-protein-dependent transport systems inner membrane component n=1 Tax=Thermodesulfatator indicus (strain DSM 15286 / JCM 11887 / CIR29812) TaxID=667014 RepID=F8ADI1_THEID|nr:ABC transporter permease [Thermodesulfatator indicus]AEH44855.1 binding-protein-dependent transport systems inner membrane component [Thermodesulfatator indicus DSM 15286]